MSFNANSSVHPVVVLGVIPIEKQFSIVTKHAPPSPFIMNNKVLSVAIGTSETDIVISHYGSSSSGNQKLVAKSDHSSSSCAESTPKIGHHNLASLGCFDRSRSLDRKTPTPRGNNFAKNSPVLSQNLMQKRRMTQATI
jgi:hypothetical protein